MVICLTDNLAPRPRPHLALRFFWDLALLATLTVAACDDPAVSKRDGSSPPAVTRIEPGPYYPGLPIVLEGNFIDDGPTSLQLELGPDPIALRVVAPGHVTAELPLDAATNLLGVHHDHGEPIELNVPVEPELPGLVFKETEPNDDPQQLTVRSLQGAIRLSMLAESDDVASVKGDAVDTFLLRIPGHDDYQDRFVIRVDQTSHGSVLPMTVSVAPDGGGSVAEAASPGGRDISVMVPMPVTTQNYVVTVTTSPAAGRQRYAVEAELVRAIDLPERAALFAASEKSTGLPTLAAGAMDLGCDHPRLADLDGDGLADVACGDIAYGTGDGSFAQPGDAGRPAAALRGVETLWRDFDGDGKLDVFVLGPGPRTHRLLVARPGQYLDQTVELGLASATGLDLLAAHAADLDADGRADLLLVPREAPPELFRNTADGFQAWTPWEDVPFQPGDVYTGSVVFDADRDGDDDWLLYRRPENIQGTWPLRLYNDQGLLRRADVGADDPLQVGTLRAVTPAFVDQDDRVDLIVASVPAGLVVHWGTGGIGTGAFEETALLAGDAGTRSLALFDLNADGALDLYDAATHGARVFLHEGGLFRPWRVSAGLPRGLGEPALIGVLDEQDATPTLLLAGLRYRATVAAFAWLTVKATTGGLPAFGARLTAVGTNAVQHRVVGLQGYNAMSPAFAETFYFAPGDTPWVEVVFPSGNTVQRQVSELDTVLEIAE